MNKKHLFFLIASISAIAHADQYILTVPAHGVSDYSIDGISFTSDKSTLFLGDSITINWSITGNPASLSISGYGPVTGKTGSVTFVPEQVSSITLTADANGVAKTKTIPITVNQYNIGTVSFSSDKTQINKGDPLILTWSTTGIPKTVTIDGIGIVANTGSQTVYPAASGDINITVSDGSTTQTKTVQIIVFDNSSCNSIHNSSPFYASGVYPLRVNGNTFLAYCYIDSTGGWTMVGAQYESNPILWSGDITNYDPSLVTLKSFALPANYIPAHTNFAVGKDQSPLIKVKNFTYSTGNISKQVVLGFDNAKYWIHRDTTSSYLSGNPENPSLAGATLANSLTLELKTTAAGVESPSSDFTWSYFPFRTDTAHKGYAMLSSDQEYILNDYAWTIWVQ